jgi:hypothetical protein
VPGKAGGDVGWHSNAPEIDQSFMSRTLAIEDRRLQVRWRRKGDGKIGYSSRSRVSCRPRRPITMTDFKQGFPLACIAAFAQALIPRDRQRP